MLQVSHWQIRSPSNLTRFVLLALLSVSLMLLDARGHHLQKIRAGLTVLFVPIQMVAAFPVPRGRCGISISSVVTKACARKIERLRAEQPILLARLQKFEAIEAENAHLRQLLGTSALVADRAVVGGAAGSSERAVTGTPW